jgi:NRPS condensation-like uncharacterized protein
MHLWYLAGLGNQVISLQLDFDSRLDKALLSRATQLLLRAEPLLASRLEIDAEPPSWTLLEEPSQDVLRVVNDSAAYEAFARERLDAAVGPQVGVCLWRRRAGDRLLLKMTHQLTDAAGVRDVAARLAGVYSRLASEPDYEPAAAPAGSRDIDQVLRQLPKRAYPRLLLECLKLKFALRLPPAPVAAMPLLSGEAHVYVVRELDPGCVSLLAEYGHARAATLNDLFLAALHRALSSGVWPGLRASPLATTVDLRRWYLPDAAAETICNLPSGEILSLRQQTDFNDALAEVVAVMGRRKRRLPGLAMALLSRLANPSRRVGAALLARDVESIRGETPLPWFSNMGVIGQEGVCFAGLAPSAACLLAPVSAPPWLEVGLSGYEGSLTLSLGVPVRAKADAEALLDAIVAALPR